MVKIYSCEGNIGAGKTTLISHLEQMCKVIENKKIILLREPVDIWEQVCDEEGKNILKHFYLEPEKYAFAFQILAFTTRLSILKNTIKENPHCDIIICERSIYADGNIFAKMLHDDKQIDTIHYEIYKKMYDDGINDFPLTGVIYLTIPPEECARRIIKRGRAGEENIPIEYLNKCHNYHESWLRQNQNFHIKRMNEKQIKEFVECGSITDVIVL